MSAPVVQRGRPLDRIAAVFPLTMVYLCLCIVYLFEAWARVTPWLFGDELELTQLSRSIAATGRAARRGQAHTPDSLYVYVTAPWWLIHDVAAAYSAIKYADVFLMASVVFPTYFLARLVAGRNTALLAAACAGAIPSLAYSSYIVEETVAYPYAALCLFLIAKAFLTRRRSWLLAAVAASALAPAVRGELVMIPATFALAGLFMLWSGERSRRRRASWTIGDWIGWIVLLFGAVFLISGIASHHSIQWLTITRAYKDRIFNMGNWAAGSLAVGIGVIPFVAGLAVLVRAPGEEPSRPMRVFRSLSVATLISFALYTAMKAAYLSTVFATRVEERNLIYVAPVLFVGTAIALEFRRLNLLAAGAATLYALYLTAYAVYHVVGGVPYEMGVQLYSDALGFSIFQQANRYLSWTPTVARIVVLAVIAGGVLLLFAPRFLAGRRGVATVSALLLSGFLLAWNLTGEIAAAAGTVSIAHDAGTTLRHPYTWVDDLTHLRPTVYMGEGESDQNPEWLLEFWNRSIVRVSSLDGSVLGPGPSDGPNIGSGGTVQLGDPRGYDYAIEDTCPAVLPNEAPWLCVDFAGTLAGSHSYAAGGRTRVWRLVRLTHPNRLRAQATGISPDGWTGPDDSAYFRFAGSDPWLR
ncbi:MAG TPA: hypothetical protein VMU58_11695, partial [Gaiellaceae bacterium]|nr:hypothetical protein [Gaiellaceae bacterium]